MESLLYRHRTNSSRIFRNIYFQIHLFSQKGSKSKSAESLSSYFDRIGIIEKRPCKPLGFVNVDGELFEAISLHGFIPLHTPVRIVDFQVRQFMVEPILEFSRDGIIDHNSMESPIIQVLDEK